MVDTEAPHLIEDLTDPRLPTGTTAAEAAVFIGAFNEALASVYATDEHARRVAQEAVATWRTAPQLPQSP